MRNTRANADRLTDLSGVGTSSEIPLPNGFFDAIDFTLVAFAIFHCTFFRFFQGLFQRFHSIHRRFQTFLQFRQFTAKISILTDELRRTTSPSVQLQRIDSAYLFVHFCQLIEIIF